MPIDVSILRQQAPMQMPSLVESRARANQLMSGDVQLAANMLQFQKAQREQQEQEQVRNLLTGGQFDVNAPESMSRLAAFGGAGREAAKTLGEAFKTRQEGEAAQLKGRESLLNIIKQQTEAAQALLPSVKDYASAKRYLDFVWSSPELAERLRAAGQSPEADDKKVQEAIATGRFNDWLLRELRGAGDFAKRVGDQSAIETALTAANEKFDTKTTLDGGTMRVGFDRKGFVTEVVSSLMRQGHLELAKQYVEQQLKMADLKYAGVAPQTAHLMALQENPELFDLQRRLNAAGASTTSITNVIESEFGKAGAKKIISLVDQAPQAFAALNKARETISLIDQGITSGFAAEFRQDVDRMMALFKGKTPEQVVRTDLVSAFLGADVYQMMSAFNLGAKNIDSAAEQKYLAKVLTGTIALDKAALQRMTKLRADAYQDIVEQYNEKLANGELDKYMQATGAKLKPINVPPRVNTDADFERLKKTKPSGTEFVGADGRVRRLR